MKKVQVPGVVIGKIIGRGGEMIRKLQSESQAKIQVDHSGAGMDANHRQVTITGTNESVVKAEEMILFLCANPAVDSMQALQMLIRDKSQSGGLWGSGPPYPNFPNQGQGMPVDDSMVSGTDGNGGFGHTHMSYTSQQICGNRYGPSGGGVNAVVIESDLFPCAKMYMGRVIGQKGVTINDLQKRSGCDIQINQNVPAGQDCQISMKGSRQGIEMAKQMLQDIIELGPNHPYAGGREYQSDFSCFILFPSSSFTSNTMQLWLLSTDGQFGRVHHGGQQGYQQSSYHANQPYQPGYSHQYYGTPQYGGQPVYQQHTYQPQGQQYGVQPGAFIPADASPWRAATAADGQIYYYNQITQETQWERPGGMP
jgi:rRNA processing protein Krr1/Pno1